MQKIIRGRTGIAADQSRPRTSDGDGDPLPVYMLAKVHHDGEENYYVIQAVRNAAMRDLLLRAHDDSERERRFAAEHAERNYPSAHEYAVQVWDAWPRGEGEGDPTKDTVWDAGNPLLVYQVPNDVGLAGAAAACEVLAHLIVQGAFKQALWLPKPSDHERLKAAYRRRAPQLAGIVSASELLPHELQRVQRLTHGFQARVLAPGDRTERALFGAVQKTFRTVRKAQRRQSPAGHVARALRAVSR